MTTLNTFGGPGSGPRKDGSAPTRDKKGDPYRSSVKRERQADREAFTKRGTKSKHGGSAAYKKRIEKERFGHIRPDDWERSKAPVRGYSDLTLHERVAYSEAKNSFLKKGMKKDVAECFADEYMSLDGPGRLALLAEPYKKGNHVVARMDKMAKDKAKLATVGKGPFGRGK